MVVLTLWASPGAARTAQHSERNLNEELAFARELAVRYQYLDLAEKVLAELETQRLGEAHEASLALVRCQVSSEGAKREGDPEKRLETLEQAARSFREFFPLPSGSELRPEAERSYVDLLSHYGRALELALTEAVGDDAAALRARAGTVLAEGLERISALLEAHDRADLSPAETLEKWRLMLDRAQMRITRGSVSANPELELELAQKELETVAQEAGETSGPGLNAFLALAKLSRARERPEEAAAFAEFVVVTAVPEDHQNPRWQELPHEAKDARFRLVELAIPDLVESLSASGRTAAACKWALYFYNTWKREGLALSPLGSLALLSSARALLDAGGYVAGDLAQADLRWFETEEELRAAGESGRGARTSLELALDTAQDVSDRNEGNTLQVRAQKLIADVISRPGVSVPPDVLFEAALGEYRSGNHAAAVDSLKDVLRALDAHDDATRRAYMPKVLYQLGLAFARQNRPLEAAMAFREGATRWKGDPEYQPRLAQGFYREIGNVRRSAPEDPLIEELFLFGETLIKESDTGAGADVIRWREAERSFGQGNFEAARKIYLALGTAADEHEKALVKAALCLYRLNDREGARRELRRYIEVFVPDPHNAVDGVALPSRARKLAAREEARAQALYYLGKMAHDEGAWDEVLALFAGYEQEFAAQSEYAPSALHMVLLAEVARQDLAAARATLAKMQRAFARSPATGKAALGLYQALKAELEAAVEAGDSARARALKREMADCMRFSNHAAGEASFSALRTEATLWLELGEWVAAEEALRATLKAFEDDPERRADLERFVLPDLGDALLAQRRVPEAFALLDPLVPKTAADARKPPGRVVRAWSRAVAGWIESGVEGAVGGGAEIVEVPGVGGDFARVLDYLGKLIALEKAASEAWSCPWYGLKLEQAYALWQWSKADSSQRARAKVLLDDIASQLGDPDLRDIAAKCGNEELRRRYLWLRTQVR